MRDLCSDKNSCDVVANSVTFPDNCRGEQKILKAWYQCVGSVITTGGNANGKACRFPFKYNDIIHYQCIYEDYEYFNNNKWCRTNADTAPILEWGNCPCRNLYKRNILSIFLTMFSQFSVLGGEQWLY